MVSLKVFLFRLQFSLIFTTSSINPTVVYIPSFRLMDPLVFGNYPTVMRKIVGSRLPVFTDEDSRRIKGSYDFIGLNHYATISVQADTSQLENQLRDYIHDMAIKIPGMSTKSRLVFGYLTNLGKR